VKDEGEEYSWDNLGDGGAHTPTPARSISGAANAGTTHGGTGGAYAPCLRTRKRGIERTSTISARRKIDALALLLLHSNLCL
jgi:hypothetical protein